MDEFTKHGSTQTETLDEFTKHGSTHTDEIVEFAEPKLPELRAVNLAKTFWKAHLAKCEGPVVVVVMTTGLEQGEDATLDAIESAMANEVACDAKGNGRRSKKLPMWSATVTADMFR